MYNRPENIPDRDRPKYVRMKLGLRPNSHEGPISIVARPHSKLPITMVDMGDATFMTTAPKTPLILYPTP